jgi:hypothetical protein
MLHISFNFPCHIMTAPDIRMICVDTISLEEVKKCITSLRNSIMVQYDTTFNLTELDTSFFSIFHPYLELNNGSSPQPKKQRCFNILIYYRRFEY